MRNIPLHILDEYAKSISYKQAKRLYEAKCDNTYKKKIYKGTQYQNKNSFSVYLDNFVLNEANLTVNKALSRYVNKHCLQYNIVKEGLYLYTPLADNYMSLLEHLVKDGVSKEALSQDVDEGTSSYIQNL